jgi:hypothetical protein
VERALQEAGDDAEAVRAIYRGVLMMLAQTHAVRGGELISDAGRVLDGVEAYDSSMTLRTSRMHAGRFEITTGVRVLTAVANDINVDLLGNPITEPIPAEERAAPAEGEEAPTTRPVPLTAHRRATLRAHGRGEVAVGTGAVREQEALQREVRRGVAWAREQLRDVNVTNVRRLVNDMLAIQITRRDAEGQVASTTFLLSAERRTHYRRRLTAAMEMPDRTAEEQREKVETLQEIYNELSAEVQRAYAREGERAGETTTDERTESAYDAIGNHDRYRRVARMFFRERIRAGYRAGERAGAVFRADEIEASAWADHIGMQLDRWASTGGRGRAGWIGSGGIILGLGGAIEFGNLDSLLGPEGRVTEETLEEGMAEQSRRERRLDRELVESLPETETLPDGTVRRTREHYRRRLARARTFEDRMEVLTELNERMVRLPNGTEVGFATAVAGGHLVHYRVGDYRRRAREYAEMAEEGNVAAAMDGLDDLSADMSADSAVQRRHNERSGHRFAQWRLQREYDRAGPAEERLAEGAPEGTEHARPRGEREDRNAALVGLLRDEEYETNVIDLSYQRSIDRLAAAGDASLAAADEAASSRRALAMTPELAGALAEGIPADAVDRYRSRIEELEAAVAENPLSERSFRAAQELYGDLVRHRGDFRATLANVREDEAVSPVVRQLEADESTYYTRRADANERYARRLVEQEIIPYMRRQLRSADDGLRTREDTPGLEHYRVRRGNLMLPGDQPVGQHAYQDARDQAVLSAEYARGIMREENATRATDIIARNEELTLRGLHYTGREDRDWHEDRPLELGETSRHGSEYTVRAAEHYGNLLVWEAQNRAMYSDADSFDSTMDRLTGIARRRFVAHMADLGVRIDLDEEASRFPHFNETYERAGQGVELVPEGVEGALVLSPALRDAQPVFEGGDVPLLLETPEGEVTLEIRRGGSMSFGGGVAVVTEDQPRSTEDAEMRRRARLQIDTIADNTHNTIQHTDSSWVGDPTEALTERTSERTDEAYLALRASMLGRHDEASGHLEASVPIDFETGRDTDRETREATEWMAERASYERTTYMAVEIVGIGVTAVFAPQALPFVIGALAVRGGFEIHEQYVQQGEWTSDMTLSTVLIVGQVATLGLGAAAGAAGRTMMTGGRMVGAGGRLAGAGGRIAAAEARAVTGAGRSGIVNFFIGRPGLTALERTAHISGTMMMAGGVVQFVAQSPRMLEAVRAGQMTWAEAFAALWAGVIQNVASGGYAHWMVGRAMTGRHISRPVEIIAGFTVGTPVSRPPFSVAARQYTAVRRQLAALPEAARTAYQEHMRRNGIALPPAEEAVLLQQYGEAVREGVTFERFLETNSTMRTATYEAAYARYREGSVQEGELAAELAAYARAREEGATGAEADRAATRRAAEERVPGAEAVGRLERETDVERMVRLAEALPPAEFRRREARRPASMAARRRRARAARRMREERAGVMEGLQNEFTESPLRGTERVHVLGSGDEAITFTDAHARFGRELAYHAERVLRASPDERWAVLQQAPEGLRASIQELYQDPLFVSATRRAGGPDRAGQLRAGLEVAGRLDNIAGQTDVRVATTALEARRVLETESLRPIDLDEIAIRWQQRAELQEATGTEHGRLLAAELNRWAESFRTEAGARRTRAAERTAAPEVVREQAGRVAEAREELAATRSEVPAAVAAERRRVLERFGLRRDERGRATHADLEGRTFTREQLRLATRALRIAQLEAAGRPVPATATAAERALAARIRAHADYATADPRARMRIALEAAPAVVVETPRTARAALRRTADGRLRSTEQFFDALERSGLEVTAETRTRVSRAVADAASDLMNEQITLAEFWARVEAEVGRAGEMNRVFPSLPAEAAIQIQTRAYLELMLSVGREVYTFIGPEGLGRVPGTASAEVAVVSLDLVRQNFLNGISSGFDRRGFLLRNIGDANIRSDVDFLARLPERVNADLRAEGIDAVIYSAAFGSSSDEAGILIMARTPEARQRALEIISEYMTGSDRLRARGIRGFNEYEASPLHRAVQQHPELAPLEPYLRFLYENGRLRAGVAYESLTAGQASGADAVSSHDIVARLYRAADADPQRVTREGDVITPAEGPGVGIGYDLLDIGVRRHVEIYSEFQRTGDVEALRSRLADAGVTDRASQDRHIARFQVMREVGTSGDAARAELQSFLISEQMEIHGDTYRRELHEDGRDRRQDRIDDIFGRIEADGTEVTNPSVRDDYVALFRGVTRAEEGSTVHRLLTAMSLAEGKMTGQVGQLEPNVSAFNMLSHEAGNQFIHLHRGAAYRARERYARELGIPVESIEVVQTTDVGTEFVLRVRGGRRPGAREPSLERFLEIYMEEANAQVGEGISVTTRGIELEPSDVRMRVFREGTSYLKNAFELGLATHRDTSRPHLTTVGEARRIRNFVRLADKAAGFMALYLHPDGQPIRSADTWLGERLATAFGGEEQLNSFMAYLASTEHGPDGLRLRSFSDIMMALEGYTAIPMSERQAIIMRLRDMNLLNEIDARYPDLRLPESREEALAMVAALGAPAEAPARPTRPVRPVPAEEAPVSGEGPTEAATAVERGRAPPAEEAAPARRVRVGDTDELVDALVDLHERRAVSDDVAEVNALMREDASLSVREAARIVVEENRIRQQDPSLSREDARARALAEHREGLAETRAAPPEEMVPPRPAEAEAAPAAEREAVPPSLLEAVRRGTSLADALAAHEAVDLNLVRRLERSFEPVTREGSPHRERFELATPEERAHILRAMAEGENVADAFTTMLRRTLPTSSEDLRAYVRDLQERVREGTLTHEEINKRLRTIRMEINRGVGEALTILAFESTTPEFMEILLQDWDTAQAALRRYERVEEARSARTREMVAIEERVLLDVLAGDRGLDAAARERLVSVYGEGGTEGRLRALRELAPGDQTIDVLATDQGRVARIRERFEAAAEGSVERAELQTQLAEAQADLDLMTSQLFDLMVRGDLQSRLAEIGGLEGATLRSIEHIGGARGAFIVELEGPAGRRRLFVKTEEATAAQFGREQAIAEGLYTPPIHGGEYDTGLRITIDGEHQRVFQEFTISEDYHDYVGTRAELRLPSGETRTRTFMGVEVVGSNNPVALFARPDPDNPVHQLYFALASTREGRQHIFRAWRAYQEMSRRALLLDRWGRNSIFAVTGDGTMSMDALVRIVRERGPGELVRMIESGEIDVTFQPIDMDFVGGYITTDSDGVMDFSDFNRDFTNGSANMLFFMRRGMTRARASSGERLFRGRIPTMDELMADFLSPRAEEGAHLPPDGRAARTRAAETIFASDGIRIGNGYDASPGREGTAPGPILGGRLREYGGTRVPVAGEDARVVLHAEQFGHIADEANTTVTWEQRLRDAGLRVVDEAFIASAPEALRADLRNLRTEAASRVLELRGEGASREAQRRELTRIINERLPEILSRMPPELRSLSVRQHEFNAYLRENLSSAVEAAEARVRPSPAREGPAPVPREMPAPFERPEAAAAPPEQAPRPPSPARRREAPRTPEALRQEATELYRQAAEPLPEGASTEQVRARDGLLRLAQAREREALLSDPEFTRGLEGMSADQVRARAQEVEQRLARTIDEAIAAGGERTEASAREVSRMEAELWALRQEAAGREGEAGIDLNRTPEALEQAAEARGREAREAELRSSELEGLSDDMLNMAPRAEDTRAAQQRALALMQESEGYSTLAEQSRAAERTLRNAAEILTDAPAAIEGRAAVEGRIPIELHLDADGRIVGIGPRERLSSEARGRIAREVTAHIEEATGRLRIPEDARRTAGLEQLDGMTVTRRPPPGGPEGGPRRGRRVAEPGEGATRDERPPAEAPAGETGETRARVIGPEELVRRREARRAAEAERAAGEAPATGVELARSLELNTAEGLAEFARRLVLHERGIRTDAEVAAQFAALADAPNVQRAIRHIIGERGGTLTREQSMFLMNAQASDAMFRRYIGNRRTGAPLIEAAGGMMPEVRAAAPERVAAEAGAPAPPTVADAVGTLMTAAAAEGAPALTLVHSTRGPMMVRRGEAPSAVAPGRRTTLRGVPGAAAPTEAAGPSTGVRRTGRAARPPRAAPPATEEVLGVPADALTSRRLAYEGVVTDEAGRRFHSLEYTTDMGETATVMVPDGVRGEAFTREVDVEIQRAIVEFNELRESVIPLPEGVRDTRRDRTRVLLEDLVTRAERWVEGAPPGERRLSDFLRENVPAEYHDAIGRIIRAPARERGRTARTEAARILEARDERLAPDLAEGRELIALMERRAGRRPTSGERVAMDALSTDPGYLAAVGEGDRARAVRIAQRYTRLAEAADSVIAPPELVTAELQRLNVRYRESDDFAFEVIARARAEGKSEMDVMREMARATVICNEQVRTERAAGFGAILEGRSIGADGEMVIFSESGPRGETRTWTLRAYERAVELASHAEDVIFGNRTLAQIPEDVRPTVHRLVNDIAFVEATLRMTPGGDANPNRRAQLAVALDPMARTRPVPPITRDSPRATVAPLQEAYNRYLELSRLTGDDGRALRMVTDDPMEQLALRRITELQESGIHLAGALSTVSQEMIAAHRYATMTIEQARTPRSRMIVRFIENQAEGGRGTRASAAFEFVSSLTNEALRVRTLSERGGRPITPLEGTIYDLAHLAARRAGRETPIPVDWIDGVIAARTLETFLAPEARRAPTAEGAPLAERATRLVTDAPEAERVALTELIQEVGPERVERILTSIEGIGSDVDRAGTLARFRRLLERASAEMELPIAERHLIRFLSEATDGELMVIAQDRRVDPTALPSEYFRLLNSEMPVADADVFNALLDRVRSIPDENHRNMITALMAQRVFRQLRSRMGNVRLDADGNPPRVQQIDLMDHPPELRASIEFIRMFGLDPSVHQEFPWAGRDLMRRAVLFHRVEQFRADLTAHLNSAFPGHEARVADLVRRISEAVNVQDVADTNLPYTPHGWQHSLEVIRIGREVFQASPALQESLIRMYGSRERALAALDLANLLHDIGYGELARGASKGEHPVISGNLMRDRYVRDIAEVFGLRTEGRTSAELVESEPLIREIYDAVLYHGADKPGATEPRYTPASDTDHPLLFITRLADNLDMTMARMRAVQTDQVMLQALHEMMEAGQRIRDSNPPPERTPGEAEQMYDLRVDAHRDTVRELIAAELERIRSEYRVTPEMEGMFREGAERPERMPRFAEGRSFEDALVLSQLLDALNDSTWPHFVGCERVLGYEMSETVGPDGRPRLVINVGLSGGADAGVVSEGVDGALYQVYRMSVARRSLFYGRDIPAGHERFTPEHDWQVAELTGIDIQYTPTRRSATGTISPGTLRRFTYHGMGIAVGEATGGARATDTVTDIGVPP